MKKFVLLVLLAVLVVPTMGATTLWGSFQGSVFVSTYNNVAVGDNLSGSIWVNGNNLVGLSWTTAGASSSIDFTSGYSNVIWDPSTGMITAAAIGVGTLQKPQLQLLPSSSLFYLNAGTGGAIGTSATVTPVPAPGAILLGMMGTGLVGWLRRRRSL